MKKMMLVVLGLCGVIGLVALANSNKKMATEFTGEINRCQTIKECVTAIQPDTCCPCAQVINKKVIGSNGWIEYDKLASYPGSQELKCHSIECKICAVSEKLVCENSQCGFGW